MSKKQSKKDSWSTTSSSRSSSSSSTRSSYSRTRSYSTFSSNSDDELKKLKRNSDNDRKKGSRESLNSFISSSNDSLASSISYKSKDESKVLDNFQVTEENLPLNVLQLLLSIKESEMNVYTLKMKHESNSKKLKHINGALKNDLEKENEKITESLFGESSQLISLNMVIYGENHCKLAWAHINMAEIYLECMNLPKQAKAQCDNAFRVQIEYLKKLTVEEEELEQLDEVLSLDVIDDQNYQMKLNYIYGRSCGLLKENKESEKSLEKSEDYFLNWKSDMKSSKEFIKFKPLICRWQKKIYLALAKQYAINKNYANAFVYYEKLIDIIERKKLKSKPKNGSSESTKNIDQLLIEIYESKSKIEKDRDNFKEAVQLQKDAIRIAEASGSNQSVLSCKFNLAKLYSCLDDMTSSSNAEDLFNDCLYMHEKSSDGLNDQIIKIKEEFVKFYLKQDRYDDCCKLLNEFVKNLIEFYGQYNSKLSMAHKLLCSVYLKKNDMPSAAKFLKKSLEFEELNYGAKDKRTLATKETLEELKKNPNVQEKLKSQMKSSESKPNFHAGKKVNYYKDDLKIYSQTGGDEKSSKPSLNISIANTSRNEDVLSNINPLK